MSQTLQTLLHFLRGAGDPAGSLTDADLLERYAVRQDAAAFAALVARHGPMVLSVCRRLLADPQDAEDAFQATFLVLVRKAAALRASDPVGAWLHGVARRVATRARSDRAGRRARERRAAAMSADASPAVLWDDLRPILDQEVGQLPEKYRVPVVLCYLGGKTYDEAAREIGCPKGTVATRLSKAREFLRQRLAARGVTLSAGGLVAVLADSGRAAVPTHLFTATLEAATAGAVPAAVARLAAEILTTMTVSKLKVVTGLLAVAGLFSAGAGALAHRTAGTSDTAGVVAALDDRHAPLGGWIRVVGETKALVFRPDGTGRAETALPPVTGNQPSPDGKMIVGVRPGVRGNEVFVADADGANARRVSPEGVAADWPSWSPDGARVAFTAEKGGMMQAYLADRDGRNLRLMSDGPQGVVWPRFSPDGRLTYLRWTARQMKARPADLVVDNDTPRDFSQVGGPQPPRPAGTVTLVKNTAFSQYAWSPDGKTIAFGKPQAFVFLDVDTGKEQVIPLADIDKRLVSHAAALLAWSPDSRAVACWMVFWGGRQANGPKMLGDEEVFVIPRAGKPIWFQTGGPNRRLDWLSEKPVKVRDRLRSRPVLKAVPDSIFCLRVKAVPRAGR